MVRADMRQLYKKQPQTHSYQYCKYCIEYWLWNVNYCLSYIFFTISGVTSLSLRGTKLGLYTLLILMLMVIKHQHENLIKNSVALNPQNPEQSMNIH